MPKQTQPQLKENIHTPSWWDHKIPDPALKKKVRKVLARELDNAIAEEEGKAKANTRMTVKGCALCLNRNHAKHEKFSTYK